MSNAPKTSRSGKDTSPKTSSRSPDAKPRPRVGFKPNTPDGREKEYRKTVFIDTVPNIKETERKGSKAKALVELNIERTRPKSTTPRRASTPPQSSQKLPKEIINAIESTNKKKNKKHVTLVAPEGFENQSAPIQRRPTAYVPLNIHIPDDSPSTRKSQHKPKHSLHATTHDLRASHRSSTRHIKSDPKMDVKSHPKLSQDKLKQERENKAQRKPVVESEPEPKQKHNLRSVSDLEPKSQPKQQPKPKPSAQPEPKQPLKQKLKTKPVAAPEPEQKLKLRPVLDLEPKSHPQQQIKPIPVGQLAPKQQPKPEPETEHTHQLKPKPVPEPEPKQQHKSQPVPEPEPKLEPKKKQPETNKGSRILNSTSSRTLYRQKLLSSHLSRNQFRNQYHNLLRKNSSSRSH